MRLSGLVDENFKISLSLSRFFTAFLKISFTLYMDKGSFLIKPLMNLWDYDACAGKSELSINEICISLYILSPALRLRFRWG